MFEIGGRKYPMDGEDYISRTVQYDKNGTVMCVSGIKSSDISDFSK